MNQHELNQLAAKDRRNRPNALRPISSFTAIQLDTLREKLTGEYLIAGDPADGADGSPDAFTGGKE